MRQYKTEIKEIKKVAKIICNKCGKVIPVTEGIPQEDVLTVEKRWGYHSRKDNQVDCFDLCEDCYDELVDSFLIQLKKPR
ncbi:hypothetical protein [Faecalicatena contorta]|uniref:hypothetical protein n=1 Tax=Faecalicatena contorta TaxID=39482 RepID=UPI001F26B651|nr:hypothetical protein [Faecalicatena contorta]MCF2681852.1 hypothetical protein [Faecalicatena contorta]